MSEGSSPQAADDRVAFMTALTTEHFVLQTAASTTVTEASSRASLYLLTLSSALVAIGFSVDTDALAPLLGAALPVVVVLGAFTTVRLVDTGVQNLAALTNIAHIRSYYRTLSSDAPSYFRAGHGDESDEALTSIGARRAPSTGMFTMASMIAVVNSIVAASGATLAVATWSSRPAGFIAGAIVAVFALTTFFWYQARRYRAFHSSRQVVTAGR